MDIVRLDPTDRHLIQAFLDLPFRIYKDTPQWVPPIQSEIRQVLDRRRNPFFQHSVAEIFLCLDAESQAIGRLAVLDNRRYNEFNHDSAAFFYLFESYPDPTIAQALFDAGFAWACQRGLIRILGPRGFTPFDGLGLLVEGFQHRPAFGLPYNPPYYAGLLEALGFELESDLVSGYLPASMEFPERIHQLAARLQARRGLRVARFRTRRDLRSFLPRLKELYNQSLEGTTGNYPLTDQEVKNLASQLLWLADPRLIKIVYKGQQPVGFLFAYPDLSAALQRQRGRLFPFGWLDAILELRRTDWININGAAILEGYRGLGGTALLFSEMHKSVVEGGYQHADIVQIGVENEAMQREMRALGIDFYKTHRVYRRSL